MAIAKQNKQAKPAPVVLILGEVNARKIMRQRPDVFAGATVLRNVRPTFTGARADWELAQDPSITNDKVRDGMWRAHCSRLFGAKADECATHADTIATDSAGTTLTIIHSVDALEHDPSRGMYSKVPGLSRNPQTGEVTGAYLELIDCADEVIVVS